jgi:glycosyltransferase involved in cell wall biosynthesis
VLWWILLVVGWLVAAVWLSGAVPTARFLRRARLADRAGSLRDPENWPTVSVIVPARDEVQRIEQTLRSLAQSDYPALEVVVVDDRSSDGTAEIVDRVANAEPRVEAVHVSDLPEGWLGKCHAMHVGTQRASGEILIFTDGDVVFGPETIRLAVRYAVARKLDHLTLIPGLTPGGHWEDAVKSYFAMLFVFGTRAWKATSPSKDLYVGAGAFNLVRRSAYEAIGGHAPLRLEVADDLMLGKRIKHAGHRQEALLAPGHLRLAWYAGVRGYVRGLEKNGFASLGYSVPFLLLVTGFIGVLYTAPYLGVLAFRDARVVGYATSVVVMHAIFGYVASFVRNRWYMTFVLPVTAFVYLWAVWRSTLITLRQGGIRWRGTFYPLDLLRRGPSA